MNDIQERIAQAARPNIIDRTIRFFNPAAGARRMHARVKLALADGVMSSGGGYTGARKDRRTTTAWLPAGSDANAAQLPDLPTLRDRSRDLARNTPIATGAILTASMNVVGTGLALQCAPDYQRLGMSQDQAAEWAANTESEFRVFADNPRCDITRTQDFYGQQNLVFRGALEGGDIFTLLPMLPVAGSPYKTRLQVIEADRVANPRRGMFDGTEIAEGRSVFSGVEKDRYGAPIAYYILRKHPGGLDNRGEYITDRYEAFGQKTGRRNVLHIYDRLRPDQTRGVPYLAPVIEILHTLGKYSDAELMAALVSSLFTVFVKTPSGQSLDLTQSVAANNAGIVSTTTSSTSADQKPLEMGSGLIVDLADGDDVTFANPGRPNAAFDGFTLAVQRQIGVALGLPFEILVKHFTASYSAARAALLEAWRFYINRRNWLAGQFCQPVFEAWMDEAVSLGRISAPGYFSEPSMRAAWLNAEWIGDAMGSIDPLKEINAASARVELGVSSRTIETMQLTGQVYEKVHSQQVREKKMRERDGLEGMQSAPASGSGAPTKPDNQDNQNNNDGSDLEDGDMETGQPQQRRK